MEGWEAGRQMDWRDEKGGASKEDIGGVKYVPGQMPGSLPI